MSEIALILHSRSRSTPVALQLRYLQTLAEVATEHNSTTLFPLPINLLSAFLHERSIRPQKIETRDLSP